TRSADWASGLAAVIFSMMFSVILQSSKLLARGGQLGLHALERQVQFHLTRYLLFFRCLRPQAADFGLKPLTISQGLPTRRSLFRGCRRLVASRQPGGKQGLHAIHPALIEGVQRGLWLPRD